MGRSATVETGYGIHLEDAEVEGIIQRDFDYDTWENLETILKNYPLLDIIAGHWDFESEDFAIIIKNTKKTYYGTGIHKTEFTQPTAEEVSQMQDFQEKYHLTRKLSAWLSAVSYG